MTPPLSSPAVAPASPCSHCGPPPAGQSGWPPTGRAGQGGTSPHAGAPPPHTHTHHTHTHTHTSACTHARTSTDAQKHARMHTPPPAPHSPTCWQSGRSTPRLKPSPSPTHHPTPSPSIHPACWVRRTIRLDDPPTRPPPHLLIEVHHPAAAGQLHLLQLCGEAVALGFGGCEAGTQLSQLAHMRLLLLTHTAGTPGVQAHEYKHSHNTTQPRTYNPHHTTSHTHSHVTATPQHTTPQHSTAQHTTSHHSTPRITSHHTA